MATLTDTPAALVAHVTEDDLNVLWSVQDQLEKASTGNVDPVDAWKLVRELDAVVSRWRREARS